ncbi:MAG: hypothetical protein Kow0059_11120 [Candidatus Sumerlaeia bacterium]
MAHRRTILFCGKHRVNFAMFEPVYQLLRRDGRVDIRLSSGRYRRKPLLGWLPPKHPDMRNEVLFAEFDVDPRHFVKTSCQDTYPWDVYVSSNLDSKLQPPRSRASVQLFHGVSFRNFAVRADYLRFSRIFFPGRYHLEQYLRRGLLKEGDPRIALIGMPKLDALANGAIRRDEVLESLGLDPTLPTVLWCPTGARHNSYERLGEEGLRAIQGLGVNLIVKLHDHPHLPGNMTLEELHAQVRAALGERGRLATRSDVTPLLAAADALVSDASSVAYEYCILDRPIVFVDVPELLAERASQKDCAMDENTHGRSMGRIVKTARELQAALEHALEHPDEYSAERRATAAHLFHDPGRAARRAAAALLELAGVNDSNAEQSRFQAVGVG